jgi:hypothetical protein
MRRNKLTRHTKLTAIDPQTIREAQSLKQRIAGTWRTIRTSCSYVSSGNGEYHWEHMDEFDTLVAQYTEKLKAIARVDPEYSRQFYKQVETALSEVERKLKGVDEPDEETLCRYELLYKQRDILQRITVHF